MLYCIVLSTEDQNIKLDKMLGILLLCICHSRYTTTLAVACTDWKLSTDLPSDVLN